MNYDTSNCTVSCHANLNPCGHELAQARQNGLASITRQIERLHQALDEVSRTSAQFQDQLQQLLSYCWSEVESPNPDWSAAYNDMADRLAEILDGEL